MNVVDSSGWLTYLEGGPQARLFAKPIEDVEHLLVPSIVLMEVFKRLLQQGKRKVALRTAAHMERAGVVDLNAPIAVSAAYIGRELKLPLADSVILATARAHDAVLWTMDADFKGIDGVRFFARSKRKT